MKPNRLLSCFFLAALVIVISPTTNTTEAVSLSPLIFELSANPGEAVSNVIRITNPDPSPVNIVIEIEDFAAIGEEGQVTLQPGEDNLTYSLAKWVTVTPSAFTIPAHDSRSVQFTINIPIDAEPGGHYSSVLASVKAVPVEGGVSIAQKVGSLLLLNVAGDVEERLNVEELFVEPFSEYGPVDIVSRFENTGTIHLKPRGFILIKNIFGQEIEKLDLPQKNVLPRSVRRIEIPWGERLMFGKYEATLTAIYGSTNEPLSAVTSFWVIPWKIASAVAIGIIILLTILIRGRKRFRLALSVIFRGTHRHPSNTPHA